MKYITQLRRGSAEEWATVGKDIVPLEGELVLELDKSGNNLHRLKIGDGVSLYSKLPYMSVDSFILSKSVPKTVTITLLASNWHEVTDDDDNVVKNSWSQTVLQGSEHITVNSKIDLQPSVTQLIIFHEKDLTFVAENEDGVVTVFCVGQKPMNDYTIDATVTEVV